MYGRQLNIHGTVGVVFDALSADDRSERLAPASSSKGAARCPSLRAIYIEGPPGWDVHGQNERRNLLNLVAKCLRSRAGNACKLKALTFQSFLPIDPAGTEDLLEEMKKLVDNVIIL